MLIKLTDFRLLTLVVVLFVGNLSGCSDPVQKTKGDDKMVLEENAKKDGVKVTESGLQYEVLKEGDGPKPTESDTVNVHYAGTLTDGTEFDSSYKRGEPISFPLNRVIKGWTEGLQLMSVGSKYRLTVPGDLAYGSNGIPQAGSRYG
jgi:FKBP-type peptidyl-prolyl cis-trans isomerase FkpA